MQRKAAVALLIIIVLLGILYVLAEYTHRGRVIGLYAFGGLKTPIYEKIQCAKRTDQKVEEKFTQPLDFDEESKNALREYWHFSYYRECLFEAGYDFYGNKIQPSSITDNQYANFVGGLSFSVPTNTIVTSDNVTNPDIEDRRLSSVLTLNDVPVNVLVYRNFDDVDSFAALTANFEHFSTSTGTISDTFTTTNDYGVALFFVNQTDGLSGMTGITPEQKVFQIFSGTLTKEQQMNIAQTLQFIE